MDDPLGITSTNKPLLSSGVYISDFSHSDLKVTDAECWYQRNRAISMATS